MYAVTLAITGFVEETHSLDAGAREAAMRDTSCGATCRCTLLSVDVLIVAGGFGAPMVREVGHVGRLTELHDMGLNPLANL